jgi:predicted type IV restriction endonuclease
MKFPVLNLPVCEFSMKKENEKVYIFDEIRRKHLVCTPEEWVRQNFIKYLINQLNYPSSLISLEMPLNLNTTAKRSDIVIFDRNGNIFMIVECKAPQIKISQKTFDQAAVYNLKLMAQYLVVTNGMEHYCCKVDFENKRWEFVSAIPNFNNIII